MKTGYPLSELALAIVVNMIAWFALYGSTWAPVFFYDDSYITLSNALALIGSPTPYNSPALTGSTSLAHVALVAALALILPPEAALGTSCLIAGTLFIAGLLAMGRAAGASMVNRAMVAVLCSWSGLTMFHVYNGLETGLALAAICWSITWMAQGRWYTVLLTIPWLPWIRPELSALSVAYLAVIGLHTRKERFSPLHAKAFSFFILSATLSTMVLLVSGADPLATADAKRNWFAEDCLPHEIKLAWTRDGLRGFSSAVLPIIFGIPLLTQKKEGWAGLFFVSTLIIAIYHKLPGGLSHYDHRYVYLATPFMFYGILITSAHHLSWIRRIGTALIVISALAAASTAIPHSVRRAADAKNFTVNHLAPAAFAAINSAQKNESIAIHDAGYIGYASRSSNERLVDIVGLKNNDAVSTHRRLTHASCGRLRPDAVADIILEKKPTYIMVLRQWDAIFHITRASSVHDGQFGFEPIWIDPNGYDVYRIRYETP